MSIGCDCQPAHHIRRRTGDDSAYMFDFLVTPITSFEVLWSDDADWFRSGNWEIAANGLRVRDKATGLEFQHEFEVVDAQSHRVDVTKVEDHLASARDKFRHLRDKTLARLAAAPDLCLIRKEWWADAAHAEAQAATILDTFSRLNPAARVVITADEADAEQVCERHMFLKTIAGPEWSGDDGSWDRVFDLATDWFGHRDAPRWSPDARMR